MANTIEGRVPLIDVDVVEKAFRFPPSSHVNSGRTKVLFREIAESYLGHAHVWRKKQGFSGPVSWWVNRNLSLFREAARSVANLPGLERVHLFMNRGIDKAQVVNHQQAHALFILYCIRRWYDGVVSDSQ